MNVQHSTPNVQHRIKGKKLRGESEKRRSGEKIKIAISIQFSAISE
jgi:hypothetical protein